MEAKPRLLVKLLQQFRNFGGPSGIAASMKKFWSLSIESSVSRLKMARSLKIPFLAPRCCSALRGLPLMVPLVLMVGQAMKSCTGLWICGSVITNCWIGGQDVASGRVPGNTFGKFTYEKGRCLWRRSSAAQRHAAHFCAVHPCQNCWQCLCFTERGQKLGYFKSTSLLPWFIGRPGCRYGMVSAKWGYWAQEDHCLTGLWKMFWSCFA